MTALLILLAVIILSFCLVIFFGAPYLPTLSKQIDDSLKLADLKSGQTLLELGCGDGRVVIAAAKQGINVVGYELNPFLAALCWLRTIKYRRNVRIVWGDFWRTAWPDCDAVFVFLLDRYMLRLDRRIKAEYKKPVKLVSFAFEIPDRKPDKQLGGVYLYKYPVAND